MRVRTGRIECEGVRTGRMECEGEDGKNGV